MEKSNASSSKTPRNRMILDGGVVGLGIVAAMSITNINNSTDIVSSAKPAANFRGTGTGTTTYGLFYASPHFLFPTPHFLNSCYLCDKLLHGFDIFIYRGERAFCSAECRETHITNDDYQEQDKCRSRVIKPFHRSISPCSASLAGILAA